MPKSTLTWYRTKTNRILKDLRLLKQKDIANELGITQQAVSNRIKVVYPRELSEIIRVLDMAGYEITEKGEC